MHDECGAKNEPDRREEGPPLCKPTRRLEAQELDAQNAQIQTARELGPQRQERTKGTRSTPRQRTRRPHSHEGPHRAWGPDATNARRCRIGGAPATTRPNCLTERSETERIERAPRASSTIPGAASHHLSPAVRPHDTKAAPNHPNTKARRRGLRGAKGHAPNAQHETAEPAEPRREQRTRRTEGSGLDTKRERWAQDGEMHPKQTAHYALTQPRQTAPSARPHPREYASEEDQERGQQAHQQRRLRQQPRDPTLDAKTRSACPSPKTTSARTARIPRRTRRIRQHAKAEHHHRQRLEHHAAAKKHRSQRHAREDPKRAREGGREGVRRDRTTTRACETARHALELTAALPPTRASHRVAKRARPRTQPTKSSHCAGRQRDGAECRAPTAALEANRGRDARTKRANALSKRRGPKSARRRRPARRGREDAHELGAKRASQMTIAHTASTRTRSRRRGTKRARRPESRRACSACAQDAAHPMPQHAKQSSTRTRRPSTRSALERQGPQRA